MKHKAIAIIAEYNPFHTGHAFQIARMKERYQPEAILVLMSGNYVQRGVPAITDMHTRARMALAGGADVVLELPLHIATASAGDFAMGAVNILNGFPQVTGLCFGCETNNISDLQVFASLLHDNPPALKERIHSLTRQGHTYPLARMQALSAMAPQADIQILNQPNNILALEYMLALKRTNSSIEPLPILRTGAGYHDAALGDSTAPSALALRQYYTSCGAADLSRGVPASTARILQEASGKSFPVQADDFSEYLFYALSGKTPEELSCYADVSEDLAKRICRHFSEYTTIDEFTGILKTKNITYTRISRALLHILLKCRRPCADATTYTRLLGFSKSHSHILSGSRDVVCISKTADYRECLNPAATELFATGLCANDLYKRVVWNTFHTTLPDDFRQSPILFP